MKHHLRHTVLFLLAAIVVIGCAQVPEEAGFGDVQTLVGERVDYQMRWNQGTEPDAEVEKAIEKLLEDQLTPEAAVQVALLNNPELQAVYEELGITQADVVEAGLLENPVIFGQARRPNKSEESSNYEFGITQNFLNILMQPARKKLSAIRFEQVKLQVADEVIRLVAEVRKSYFFALGAKQIRDLRKRAAEAGKQLTEIQKRISELEKNDCE